MKKMTLSAGAVALALLLAGCSAGTQPAPVSTPEPTVSAASEPSVAPHPVKTAGQYLDALRSYDTRHLLTDQELLLEVGDLVCERLARDEGGVGVVEWLEEVDMTREEALTLAYAAAVDYCGVYG